MTIPIEEWVNGTVLSAQDMRSAIANAGDPVAIQQAAQAASAAGAAASDATAAATAAMQAAASATAGLSGKFDKTGGTMFGDLHLPAIFATGATPGTAVSVAFGNGNYAGGAAQLTNNLPAGNLQYPTAWAGYGINNQPGGFVFGLFGRADLNVPGTATNEMDSFNNTLLPSAGHYPPAMDFGTTDHLAIALTLAAYGTARSAIGLNVAGPLGGQGFECGIYVWPTAASNFGVFIDATGAVGPAAPLLVRSRPTQVAITAQVMGLPAANAAVLNIEDANANSLASIRANGDIGNAGLTLGSNGYLYFAAPTTGLTAAAGTASTLPSAPIGYLQVVIAGVVRKIPYYGF